jgi:pimeloyl-ACP methyl ester carboxylesterase
MPTAIDHWKRATLLRAGFRARVVGTSQGRVHLLEGPGRGDRPPVVVLHGLSSRGTHFAALARHLQAHARRVILPDLLGHGSSDVPAAGLRGRAIRQANLEALDQVLDEPAVLYGNSLGGYQAITYAHARPERVAALVTTAPGGAPMPEDQLQDFLERFRVRDARSGGQLAQLVFARQVRWPRLVGWWVKRQLDRPAIRQLIDTAGPDDLLRPEQVAELRVPTLLLWGQQERVMLPQHFDFFRAHLPAHAEVEEPPGYGHNAYMEMTEDLAARIVGFVDRRVRGVAA